MDFNAVFTKAVEKAVEAKKNELIEQTLKEEHDYLSYEFEKKFGGVHNHLTNIMKKYNINTTVANKIMNIVDELMDDTKNLINGQEIPEKNYTKPANNEDDFQPVEDDWDGDAAQTEFYANYCDDEKEDDEDDVITDDDTVVTVDNEKRITVPTDILDLADFPIVATAKILKDEDTNTVYIVNRQTFDKNKTFIKYRTLDEGNFRIGVGSLLDAEPGDNVLIHVAGDQTITLTKIGKKTNDTEKKTYSMKYSLDAFVDSGKRITIPATAIADAEFEGKTVYFLKDNENNEIYITTNPENFVELEDLEKSRFVKYGESLRQGVSKLMDAKIGNEIGIDVLNGLIVLYYI